MGLLFCVCCCLFVLWLKINNIQGHYLQKYPHSVKQAILPRVLLRKNINNPLISNPLATANQAALNKVYWKGSQLNGKQTDISSILGLAFM